MVSPGGGEPAPTSVVCCMCGDHGLLPELFQCKVCLVRSQHKGGRQVAKGKVRRSICNESTMGCGSLTMVGLPWSHAIDNSVTACDSYSNITLSNDGICVTVVATSLCVAVAAMPL
ncbi:hypothetical protein BHE74_00050084 [Ensete ventricosum]|nr:hypothetical protein BHE74_00050084 [Ensete ventricosum]